MKSYFLILILLLGSYAASAQGYAGPDKATCKDGEGVKIGGPSKGAGYCYTWKPTTGLDDPQSPNPTANPTTTTTYTVTVTGPELSSTETDDVEVTVVEIKEITFDVNPFVADGDHKATPPNVISPSSRKAKWTIEGDALGCTINESTGVVTAGTEVGTITVRVEDSEVKDCFKEKTLKLEDPVKDVTARDVNSDDEGNSHTGRLAKTGETLYLISSTHGHSTAEMEAIPVRGFFPQNSKVPEWSGTGINASPGTPKFTKSFPWNSAEYTAGEKTVYVVHKPKETKELTFPGIDVLEFVERNFKIRGAAGSFQFYVTVNGKYTHETVEKKNNPGWDWKQEVSGGVSGGVNAKILHPALSRQIAAFGDTLAGLEVGVGLNGEISLNVKGKKDPSDDENPSWKFDHAYAEGTVVVKLYSLLYFDAGIVNASGEVNGNTSVKVALRTDGKKVDFKGGWEGIKVAAIFTIEWIRDPNDESKNVEFEYKHDLQVVDGLESNWIQILPR